MKKQIIMAAVVGGLLVLPLAVWRIFATTMLPPYFAQFDTPGDVERYLHTVFTLDESTLDDVHEFIAAASSELVCNEIASAATPHYSLSVACDARSNEPWVRNQIMYRFWNGVLVGIEVSRYTPAASMGSTPPLARGHPLRVLPGGFIVTGVPRLTMRGNNHHDQRGQITR